MSGDAGLAAGATSPASAARLRPGGWSPSASSIVSRIAVAIAAVALSTFERSITG